MSWTKTLKVSAGIVLCGMSAAAAAGTIVIRSSGPSAKAYPVGKSLPDGQRIALKAGDTLVVLDPKGTRTLTGAGSFEIGGSARGSAAPSAFAALIANSGSRQVRTGAVRGTDTGPARIASLWYIDVSKSGTVCLKDTTRAMLWRADMSAPVTMTLSYGGKSVPLSFSVGQAVKTWPVAEIPLAAGAEYRLSGPGLVKPTLINVAPIAASNDAPEDVAQALIARGCNAQLDVLVEAGKATGSSG